MIGVPVFDHHAPMEIYLGSIRLRTAAELADRALAQIQHHRLPEATLSVDRDGAAYIATWSDPRMGSGKPVMVVTERHGLEAIASSLEALRKRHRSAA